MKNNLLKTVIILIAVMFVSLQSCKKKEITISENNIQQDEVFFTVENGILNFNTPEDYDTQLESWNNEDFDKILKTQKQLGFNSMYAEFKKNNNLDNLPSEDIFFPLLLSTDSKIKIGNYIFTVNFENETVEAVNNSEKSKNTFTFEDDIILMLYGGESPDKSYCGGQSVSKYIRNSYECRIKYYKAGIYNSLYTQLNGRESYINHISSIGNVSWENKKDSYSGTLYTAGTGKLYYSIYKRSRRLTSYHAYLHFYVPYSGTLNEDLSCH